MKKKKIAKILRKYGFVPRHSTLREISWKKNILYPRSTWKDFLYNVMMVEYLVGNLPEDGIFIKELGFQLGGTVTIKIGKVGITPTE